MKNAALLAVLLAFMTFPGASAQDDTLFDSPDPVVQDIDDNVSVNPADALLAGDKLAVGGRFVLEAEAGLTPAGDEPFSVGLTDLSTTLFLDARPSSDFRAFVKGDLNYKTGTGLSLQLSELFADFDIGNRVFVRAGKQTVNWGVGYFFSPANLVNLERVDPEDPGEELSGPVSLKAQLPIGTDNLTGYLILGDVSNGLAASVAARYEFLLGGFEVTTGALLETGGHYALMATGSGSVGDVTVFAEMVLEGSSDKVFVVRDANNPTGLSTATSDSLFFSGTLGARYGTTTADDRYSFSVSGQYYFNGLGYGDAGVLTENPAAVSALVAAGDLSINDLQARGRHYGAVSVSSPDFAQTGLTPAVFWLGNLSDGSSLLSASLRYGGLEYVTPSLEYRFTYGGAGAEYSLAGSSQTVTLAVSVTGLF